MSNLSDTEFKTLVIRMLKELSEYLNKIKKTQAEMKDIRMGKKKRTIYRGSTVEWVKPIIKAML